MAEKPTYRHIGEAVDRFQAKLETLRAERVAEREVARAAFTGDCFECKDAGPCPHCERGRLARDEAERRHRYERAQLILRDARIPPRCRSFTLDTYADQPGHDAAALAAVRQFLHDWDGERGLILIGPYGRGKTGLLVGALKVLAGLYAAAGGQERSIRFQTAPDLFGELRAGYHDDSYERVLRRARTCGLLALDDLGAEKPSEWVQEQVYVIVNHRYERGLPMFVTSNLGMEELAVRVGERSVWRLYEQCDVVDVTGKNLRQRGAS